MRKLATVTAPTPPFGLSSLGNSDGWAMRRIVQSAPSVTLHMPEATSALRSAHTRPLKFDIMLPLPGARWNLRLLDWRRVGPWPFSEGLFYFFVFVFFCPMTPFFLSTALSAAFWNFRPSRNGCSVTSSCGTLTMPSLPRSRLPSSPNSPTNAS